MAVIHLDHATTIHDEIAMLIADACDTDRIVRVDLEADRLARWYPGLMRADIVVQIVEMASHANVIVEFGRAMRGHPYSA
jgi:hypothetical protein